MNRLRRLPLVLAPLALAASSEAAQLDLFDESTARVLLPPPPGSSPAGRALVGDVTGDALPDVLWLQGGELVLVYSPSIYRSTNAVAFAATEAVVVPTSEPGTPDAIVAVNASGAWLLTGYDAGAYEDTFLAAAWAGATHLRTGDTDGDGEHDLIGLSAAGDLLILEGVRGGTPLASEIQLPPGTLDLAVLQWNGTGAEEIAVLTTGGMAVVTRTGAVLASLPYAMQAGFLCVLGSAGAEAERCAVVTTSGGAQILFSVSAAGVSACPLGAGRFSGGSAGDADADGDDDVLLAADDGHELRLLVNRSPLAPAFALDAASSETIALAPGAPPTAWAAWPALHDLDHDGDADVLAWVAPEGEIVTLDSDAVAAESRQVEVVSGSYVLNVPAGVSELFLHVQVPADLSFEATHVQALVWRQTNVLFGAGVMEPVAVDRDAGEIDGDGYAVVALQIDEPDLFTTNVYHVELRAVELGLLPERLVVQSATPSVHAFTTTELLVGELEAQFGTGVTLRTFVHFPPEAPELVSDVQLSERALGPKEVETPEIPEIVVPPDPF